MSPFSTGACRPRVSTTRPSRSSLSNAEGILKTSATPTSFAHFSTLYKGLGACNRLATSSSATVPHDSSACAAKGQRASIMSARPIRAKKSRNRGRLPTVFTTTSSLASSSTSMVHPPSAGPPFYPRRKEGDSIMETRSAENGDLREYLLSCSGTHRSHEPLQRRRRGKHDLPTQQLLLEVLEELLGHAPLERPC